MRVVVAMSGGVDSSVAASLLTQAGHEVIGLSMQLYDQRQSPDAFGSCCSLDDLHDARRVAATLGIPHYIVNFEERFQRHVVRNFVSEYAAGRTPIPCVHCNADLKFATLVERAEALDAAAVGTGHYARVVFDETAGRYRLLRSVDAEKDQTYFLFSLTQAQLARAMFPVGHLRKDEVRAHARDRRLAVADKPDSHEICFVPDGDAGGFVERNVDIETALPEAELVDTSGRVLGSHRGVHRLTVGQRKGLGLAGGVPLYVLSLDAAEARVVVGPREELERRELMASDVNWISGEPPVEPHRITARIRHRHLDAPATVTALSGERVRVVFDHPQVAITPGQAVVFYQGEDVVGGGWIE
ncbi:MAG TPA: tRNA 2-thiouridine(34) synthase MnmA [Vicinamibacterales bacterium]|nr:tRNA 2-thiouridine(34) synthase MnmA [Vicinamibacterales bacterium]